MLTFKYLKKWNLISQKMETILFPSLKPQVINLHIEGVLEGNITVKQRGTSYGNYAYVKGSTPYPSAGNVYDYDFSALVYPKYIKVICVTEPTMAVVTMA